MKEPDIDLTGFLSIPFNPDLLLLGEAIDKYRI
jgi:hypothetical protein